MWYRKYESVALRAQKAQDKIKKLQKKDPNINPVTIEGKDITKTWWGDAWIDNLIYYADYDNRVARGKSYVKNGFVIHLSIQEGIIEAMVMGQSSTPYKIKINIEKLKKNKWNNITKLSHKYLYSLSALLNGEFPKEMESIFSNKSDGIFPSLEEMNFECSCPDWANMCKHVSAALYATGSRLDETPELIFKLRNANINQLIEKAIEKEVHSISNNKLKPCPHSLQLSQQQLSSLFNIKLSTQDKK